MIVVITTPDEVLQLAGKQPEPETFRGEIQQALDVAAAEIRAEDKQRGALEELRAWATIPTGAGARLHAEMWPTLAPAARKRLAEIVERALGNADDDQ